MTQSSIPTEVHERIIAAANKLYEEAGRERLPTVAQVRSTARADMSTTSTVMREWRREQRAPVAVTVPEIVTQANSAALGRLWQQAQELANVSLRAAQEAWDTEQAELDDAYEIQKNELDRVKAAAEAADKVQQEQRKHSANEIAAVRAELAQAGTKAERAEAKAEAVERRAGDLRNELDRAHQDTDQQRATAAEAQQAVHAVTAQLDQLRAEMAEQKQAAQATTAERDQTRAELATVKSRAEAAELAHQEHRKASAKEALRVGERLTKAESDRDAARQEAIGAREAGAKLRGHVESLQSQASELLRALATRQSATGEARTPKKSE